MVKEQRNMLGAQHGRQKLCPKNCALLGPSYPPTGGLQSILIVTGEGGTLGSDEDGGF